MKVREAREDDQACRKRRAAWTVRVYRLGEEPTDDISGETTPEERLGMMWRLTLEAWQAAGRPIPSYDRAHIPARLFGRGEPRPDDDSR